MMARMSSSARLLAWSVLLVAVALLFTATGQYDSMGTIQSRFLNQGMVVLVLGTWLVGALFRPAWRPVTPLLLPLALACAAYTLSALGSQRPRLSLEPLLGGLSIALAYLFLVTLLRDRWFRPRVGALVVIVAIAITAAYLANVGFEWAVFYRLTGRLSLPPLRPSWVDLNLGSPNLIATVLLIVGPLAVATLRRRSGRTWVAAVLGGLAFAAIFITGSRGAYIGVVLAAVVALALLTARVGGRRGLRPAVLTDAIRRRPFLLVPALLAIALALAVAPLVAIRFAQGGDSLRLDLWRSALTILAAHPLLGGGPGTWVQLKVEANPDGAANLILPHAHDLYVQVAAELGIAGVLALGLLALAVAGRLWSGLRTGGDLHAIAVAAGLAGLLGQSLVDNLVNLPFICALLLIVVAWVDSGLAPTEEDATPTVVGSAPPARRRVTLAAATARLEAVSSRLALPVVALSLAALLVSLPTLVRTDAAVLAQVSGNAADPRDPAAALAWYDEALALDPDVTLYTIQRARELARLGRAAEARAELARAVLLDPVGINLVDLALLDVAVGDPTAALDHVRLAVRRAPRDLAVGLNAGLLAARLGDAQLALDQLASAVSLRPSMAGLAILDGVPGVSHAAILARARTLVGPGQAALITAYAGDPLAARRELEALPPSPATSVLIAGCAWLGGDAASAVVSLEAIVAANPLDYVAGAWLTTILRSTGDPLAGRYGRLARMVQGDAWPGIATDLTARVAEPGDFAWALPSDYPWAVYIREYGDLVVPGLILIVPAV